MSEPTLRLGIAGAGQAARMLLPALRRTERVQVTAVADPVVEAGEALARGLGAVALPSLTELCARADVDAIYVATPTHLHAEHAIMAARNGKHLIVEKPLAVTLEDADAIGAEAERAGVGLLVGHSQSYEPPIRAMAEVVRGGELGALRMLHAWYYTDWLYRPRTPAELDTALGGGVVFRQGAHQVDLLRWIGGGLVRSVRAWTGAWDRERPAEGAYTLFLTFAGGAVATAVFSGYDHFRSSELTHGVAEDGQPDLAPPGSARTRRAGLGSQEEADLKRRSASVTASSAGQHGFYGLTVVTCERGDVRQTADGLRVYADDGVRELALPALPDGRDHLLEEAHRTFVERAPAVHGARWATANLEVCLAALESARTDREVELTRQVAVPDWL